MKRTSLTRCSDAVFGLCLLAVVAFVVVNLKFSVVDDALIFSRVADHVASGDGWVYNPGERVNPCTSFVYPLLLAGLSAVGVRGLPALLLLYGAGLCLVGIVQYAAFRKRNLGIAWVLALVSALETVLLRSAGMETSWFLAFLLGAAWAYESRAFLLCGALAALCAVTRPEGLAMMAVIVGVHGIRHRAMPWGTMAMFGLVLLPFVAFSLWAFGSVVPHTVLVKSVQAHIGSWRVQRPYLLEFAMQTPRPWLVWPLAVVGAGWVVGGMRRADGPTCAGLMVLFGILQTTAFSVLKAPVGYFWYMAAGNLAVNTAVVLALFAVGREFLRFAAKALPAGKAALLSLLGPFFALVFMASLAVAPFEPVEPYRYAETYTEIGRWLCDHTPADARVACAEIGYLGYYSKRYIRDIHGLLQPSALPALREEKWSWWLDQDPPEYIVSHNPAWTGEPSVGMLGSNERARWFLSLYQVVAATDHGIVYARKDRNAAPALAGVMERSFRSLPKE